MDVSRQGWWLREGPVSAGSPKPHGCFKLGIM